MGENVRGRRSETLSFERMLGKSPSRRTAVGSVVSKAPPPRKGALISNADMLPDCLNARPLPPKKMVIVDDMGDEKINFAGPYEEGADLNLRCQVTGDNVIGSSIELCKTFFSSDSE
ncbi:unnamed protein product [Nesidiocoris tenuis]|uniref:Uncharacterized protein n=1 Tax=Nesidiocoris tenuis TaxID=355587 RepID=A0A6H5HK33_9HEMI|nr:unnamed protein product [Nesidiocoris tenuis]